MPETPGPSSARVEITRDEVAHLADLARIELSDAELDHLAPQLSVILESVASISGGGRRRRPADLAPAAADQRVPGGRRGPRAHRRAGALGGPGGGAAALQRAADPGGRAVSAIARHRRPAARAGRTPWPPARPPRVELTRAHLDRIAAGRRRRPRLPPRRRRGRAGPGRGRRRAPRRRHAGLARSTACRSRSRTCWPPRGCRRPAARRSSRAGCRRTTPRWSRRLRAAGLPILGKTNMDEFAMGSLHRALRLRSHPQPVGPRPASPAAPAAARPRPSRPSRRRWRIGTDTGGSIRQPGCGDRHGRRQADLRRGVALRPGRDGQLARPGRSGDPHRPRRRPAARGHRRPRPARLHQHRPAAARPGRGRPRRARPATWPASRIGVDHRARRRGLPGRRAGALRRGGRAAGRTPAPRSSRCPARTSCTRSRPTT